MLLGGTDLVGFSIRYGRVLINEGIQILHVAEPIRIQFSCIDPDDGMYSIELLCGCDRADHVVPSSDFEGVHHL